MKKAVSDLKAIVFNGGSIIINVQDYTVSDIKGIVFCAKYKNSKVILKGSINLTSNDCRSIAFIAGKDADVIFDFTD